MVHFFFSDVRPFVVGVVNHRKFQKAPNGLLSL